eukprot:1177006-Prorocentrum_minimum.AAC.5
MVGNAVRTLLYTFAEPMVGNAAFVDRWEAALAATGVLAPPRYNKQLTNMFYRNSSADCIYL